MEVIKTAIDGVVIIEPRIFKDVNLDPEKGIAEDQFWSGFTYNNRGDGWAGSTGTKAK